MRWSLPVALVAVSCARPVAEPAEADPVVHPAAASVSASASAAPTAPASASAVAPAFAPVTTTTAPPAAPAATVPSTDVHALADEALRRLAARDVAGLAGLVHPKWGVRFTPYTSVDTKADVVLTQAQLAGALTDPTLRTWGSYDGSGDPIRATADGYWSKFVWDKDYTKAKPLFDARRGSGLATDNTATVYPGAHVVEWYLPARPGWLDWSALRLVFAPDGKHWWLVGVIHDQWVI